MARRVYGHTQKKRVCVKEVKSFLKEIFGEYIANILIQETISNRADTHRLSDGEIRALIEGMDELFGCCGEILYQLMEFEDEELSV